MENGYGPDSKLSEHQSMSMVIVCEYISADPCLALAFAIWTNVDTVPGTGCTSYIVSKACRDYMFWEEACYVHTWR